MVNIAIPVNVTNQAAVRSGRSDRCDWHRRRPKEIIVLAHHSYFEAAFDNASGMATMMGLADYFTKIIDRGDTLDRAARRPDAWPSSSILPKF